MPIHSFVANFNVTNRSGLPWLVKCRKNSGCRTATKSESLIHIFFLMIAFEIP
ncbi:MAG: hypothetical protein LBU65_11320 [Planctomycetaceae bacterium]|nr:hypothetical protein [Planctomycetaceae bacterium]